MKGCDKEKCHYWVVMRYGGYCMFTKGIADIDVPCPLKDERFKDILKMAEDQAKFEKLLEVKE